MFETSEKKWSNKICGQIFILLQRFSSFLFCAFYSFSCKYLLMMSTHYSQQITYFTCNWLHKILQVFYFLIHHLHESCFFLLFRNKKKFAFSEIARWCVWNIKFRPLTYHFMNNSKILPTIIIIIIMWPTALIKLNIEKKIPLNWIVYMSLRMNLFY